MTALRSSAVPYMRRVGAEADTRHRCSLSDPLGPLKRCLAERVRAPTMSLWAAGGKNQVLSPAHVLLGAVR